MKKGVLILISATFFLSCNETKKEEKQLIGSEEVTDVMDSSVSLFARPTVFDLSQLPDTLAVRMSNNISDTITTGRHYQIEHFTNGQWKEITPKDIAFQDLGLVLNPTESLVFEKRLYTDRVQYMAGKYRIVKYYLKSDFHQTRERIKVYAEFEIE